MNTDSGGRGDTWHTGRIKATTVGANVWRTGVTFSEYDLDIAFRFAPAKLGEDAGWSLTVYPGTLLGSAHEVQERSLYYIRDCSDFDYLAATCRRMTQRHAIGG